MSAVALERKQRKEDFEQAAGLLQQYFDTKDKNIRDRLVLMHQNLVRFLAGKFTKRGEPLEDLVQVGIIGLINAIDRYDPSRGTKFSTYATPTIVGEIRRYFRDKAWSLKVPRRLQELNLAANKAADRLSQELGHPPTIQEIAAELEATEQETLEAIELGNAYDTVSLDLKVAHEGDSAPLTLAEFQGELDIDLQKIQEYGDLMQAIESLEPREKAIIYYRFFRDMSQTQVAKRLNISQMHVSRLQQKAVRSLKEFLAIEDSTSISGENNPLMLAVIQNIAIKSSQPFASAETGIRWAPKADENGKGLRAVKVTPKLFRTLVAEWSCLSMDSEHLINFQGLADRLCSNYTCVYQKIQKLVKKGAIKKHQTGYLRSSIRFVVLSSSKDLIIAGWRFQGNSIYNLTQISSLLQKEPFLSLNLVDPIKEEKGIPAPYEVEFHPEAVEIAPKDILPISAIWQHLLKNKATYLRFRIVSVRTGISKWLLYKTASSYSNSVLVKTDKTNLKMNCSYFRPKRKIVIKGYSFSENQVYDLNKIAPLFFKEARINVLGHDSIVFSIALRLLLKGGDKKSPCRSIAFALNDPRTSFYYHLKICLGTDLFSATEGKQSSYSNSGLLFIAGGNYTEDQLLPGVAVKVGQIYNIDLLAAAFAQTEKGRTFLERLSIVPKPYAKKIGAVLAPQEVVVKRKEVLKPGASYRSGL